MSGEHLPQRPQWTCRVCADDWPCTPALRRLTAEMTRTPMCLYLAAYLVDAISDQPAVPSGTLYLRFLQPARCQPAPSTTAPLGRNPMPSDVPVRSATPDDHRHIAGLLTAAFAPGPIGQWFHTDAALRAAYTRAFFDRVVSSAMLNPRALIHLTQDGSAVAIWYDHRDDQAADPVGYDTEFTALDADPVVAPRLALLHAMLTGIHTTAAHFHLGYLAVEPSQQKQHLSDSMLRYQHPFLDLAATPAYAVAHTDVDLAVLRRHGYRINEPTRSHDGLELWPAWRPPHPPTHR